VGGFADPEDTRNRKSLDEIKSGTGLAALDHKLNPLALEMYLSDTEFISVFRMNKEKFYAMKQWKQRELKKKVGIF